MRLLLLLILAGVGAYFTVPTQAQHEEAARLFLEERAGLSTSGAAEPAPFSLDSVVDFVTGMMAGAGRYESFYLGSKYTLDLPGADYLECYGAFTLVQCQQKGAGASG